MEHGRVRRPVPNNQHRGSFVNHTIGPWRAVKEEYGYTIETSGKNSVTLAYVREPIFGFLLDQRRLKATIRANAKVLAGAPELLEAATDLAETIEKIVGKNIFKKHIENSPEMRRFCRAILKSHK